MNALYKNFKEISEQAKLLETQKLNAFKQIIEKASQDTLYGCVRFDNEDDDDLNAHQFYDNQLETYQTIIGMRVNQNNSIEICVYEDFDGDFHNRRNWFNPFLYGTFDMENIVSLICENYI